MQVTEISSNFDTVVFDTTGARNKTRESVERARPADKEHKTQDVRMYQARSAAHLSKGGVDGRLSLIDLALGQAAAVALPALDQYDVGHRGVQQDTSCACMPRSFTVKQCGERSTRITSNHESRGGITVVGNTLGVARRLRESLHTASQNNPAAAKGGHKKHLLTTTETTFLPYAGITVNISDNQTRQLLLLYGLGTFPN